MSADNKSGMDYAPVGASKKVEGAEQFVFAAVNLDHGHIYGMCNGLLEAGARLKWVYDRDEKKVAQFVQKFPQVQVALRLEDIWNDQEVLLIAAAAIPNERADLGMQAMKAGKHYFTDKAPFTTLEQLEAAKRACKETGKKYAVYYSERLHVESAIYAGELVSQGAIGRVIQMIGLGPHRLQAASRPSWFFNKEQYGGILCDLASHQIEQFLYFSGNKSAKVLSSQVANYHHKQYTELEDFGDIHLAGENGATAYIRVDWFTPDGLSTWGDGRTIILGTDGYIELRKYVDIARSQKGDHLYLVNSKGEQHFELGGQVGFPFFGQLILDCLHETEYAMTQEHIFQAAELTLLAQQAASKIE